MSEYVQVSFVLNKNNNIESIKTLLGADWDAWSITPAEDEKNKYILTISELNLRESLFILDKLVEVFDITFFIEHGIYN